MAAEICTSFLSDRKVSEWGLPRPEACGNIPINGSHHLLITLSWKALMLKHVKSLFKSKNYLDRFRWDIILPRLVHQCRWVINIELSQELLRMWE